MHLPTFLKYLALAWGLPLVIIATSRFASPDPDQKRSDFPGKTFKPARVWVVGKKGTKGSDHFELRIESPDGAVYFHRDPNPEPVAELDRKFPRDTEVTVLYQAGLEGNVLMEIAAAGAASPVLSFDDIMAEYASRRRLVGIVAAVWWILANLFAFALWKFGVPPKEQAGS
jgi:hypothetical protein